MFNFGFGELMVILILALIIFGPGKLPQVGAALGKGIAEFKKAARGLQDDLNLDDKDHKGPSA
ncbi:MAG: twin-arginine translocase TatA/TatE family subunit [Candidatus Wallbacteria bacterium]|nr:twin-arginine translocase TatA/TatE family subunit [Candidatus Wallbacteria bacterium]